MPPRPEGTVQEQLERQYAYLFQMAQQLNLALDAAAGGPAASGGGTNALAKPPAAHTPEMDQALKRQYQTLKSMIVQAADIVKKQMDQLTVELAGEYVAVSEFGSYVEKLNSYIEANPDALTQYYSFCADLKADTEAVSSAFESYKAGTEGYIRTGVVYYDGALPVYGVAVGQNLQVTEMDGVQTVEPNNFRATFTATKLSFWQDAEEVAYVSNNRLYITRITVLEGMDVGEWKVSGERGLTFQWIGG